MGRDEFAFEASVVIVCYNQPASLRLALEALSRQEFDGSFEIIIADDGSSSELFAGLHPLMSSIDTPTFYIWQQDRNMRPSASRNKGIALARGALLIFLDGDMVPEKEFVAKHVRAHASDGQLMVAGNRLWRAIPEVLDLGSQTIWSVLDSDQCKTEPLMDRERKEQSFRREVAEGVGEFQWRLIFGCNFSVPNRSEVFFDEDMFGWGPEDWELACRLTIEHGYSTEYRPDIIAWQAEASDLFFNVFRRGRHEEVVCYLRNIFHFVDKHSTPTLDLTPILTFGFSRLALDVETDRWYVTRRAADDDWSHIISQARQWLSRNGVYDSTQAQHLDL